MRSSHGSKRRIFRSALSLAWKIAARTSVMPLGLIVIVFGQIAIGATLGLDFSWPGQYDTETGASPASTISSRCVPDAYPTLAAGGPIVELGTNPNYGIWPANGQADKSFPEALTNFFAGAIPSHNWVMGQPKLLYDNSGGRFILIASAFDTASQPPQAWIAIGASAINHPQQFHDCTYSFDANSNSGTHYWGSNPQLGMTKDAFVITADMRAFDNNNTFQYATVWMIPKQSIYNIPGNLCPPGGFPIHNWQRLTNPGGDLASQVTPAKSYAANSPVTYLISAYPNGGSSLSLWTLDSDNVSLSLAQKLPVQPYPAPPAAPQKGTTQLISTGDARLVNAVYFNESGLWTVQTAACPNQPGRSCFKWYQLNPVAGTVIQDSYFGYSVDFVYAPAVVANRNGDAVFVFNASSSNHYVDVDFVGACGWRRGKYSPVARFSAESW